MAAPQILTVASILTTTSICCALAALVCAWRVYDQRLVGLYPAFFSYLLSQGVLLAVSGLVGVSSLLYRWVFIVAYPITWVVYCLMVRELYNQIFNRYPGIAMLGRWSVYLAVASAGAIAIVSRIATRGVLVRKSALLIPIEVAGQNVVFGIALSIIVLLLLISRYPLELHRNVLVNCMVFSALLLGEAAELLVEHLTNMRNTRVLDVASMVFNIGCFGVWGFLLSPQGARKIIQIHHGFSANDERRLLGQLNSLNAWGVRASRK
jgi:hypothetical protein